MLSALGNPFLSNHAVTGNNNKDKTKAEANNTNRSFSHIIPMIITQIENKTAAKRKAKGDLFVIVDKKLLIS